MRILQIIRSMGFGGAENHVLSLSAGLRDLGHEVLLVAPAGSWVSVRCVVLGLSVEHIAMCGMADLPSYWRLRRLVRTWRPDIVHAHQVRPSQYAGIATLGTPVIPISTVHSTGARKHMHRSKHLIAVSDAVAENLARHRYPRERITRIYNGVPDVDCPSSAPFPTVHTPATRKELRDMLEIPEGQFALVCAARFNPQKGQDLLVRSAKFWPGHVHLYFIGDAMTDFGKSVVTEAKADPRIHFLGFRENVRQLLLAFDAYVSPSRREAFSLSLAEAAAARLPVVATRVGGVPEVVLDGVTGLLVPPEDSGALAGGIAKLVANQELAAIFACNARLRYESEFTVEKMVSRTCALYVKVLAEA
ncbi:MAG: glycosyltransferase [Puniceicoccales bacterium]|jgi:glycosyltransferase involved in cell wall biosynthesis|nr:glycosyltransferase [Puniceicoccales bacterium]